MYIDLKTHMQFFGCSPKSFTCISFQSFTHQVVCLKLQFDIHVLAVSAYNSEEMIDNW